MGAEGQRSVVERCLSPGVMELSNEPLRPIGLMVKEANPIADILVIDDDPIIRRILQRMLQSQGYRVAIAETAADGLKQALAITPPVV